MVKGEMRSKWFYGVVVSTLDFESSDLEIMSMSLLEGVKERRGVERRRKGKSEKRISLRTRERRTEESDERIKEKCLLIKSIANATDEKMFGALTGLKQVHRCNFRVVFVEKNDTLVSRSCSVFDLKQVACLNRFRRELFMQPPSVWSVSLCEQTVDCPMKQGEHGYFQKESGFWICEESVTDDVLPTLEDQGVRQLYPKGPNVGIFQKGIELNREMQLHILELADVLIERPSQYARRVEDISLIFKNLHHLLNSLRPHQARATLIHILELQLQRQKQDVEDIKSCTMSTEGP
ncbi:hypothetical protein CTI12_AA212300 [Artemisia annua]|uniref:Mediator of RNA polymerase II transcription subunit 7 n=1 Tax=Artemisia annua TaxID=35608 RepID=A0A2U1NZ37_ARTAN|nr:hypothetical protein CTI12_AA212300 [Artemisia annua]